jgi:SAM-dependent methyltransferase
MPTHVSATYYRRYKPHLHRRIAQELAPARRIVDVGCGDCGLASLLSERDHHEVFGVDISDDRFPNQPDPGHRQHCVKADARSLDFLSRGTVDAVVSVWALHEFAAPMAVLREARRILRPGGGILIVDFARGSLAQQLWKERYYTTKEVGQMLKRAGFARVEATRIARRQLTWARGFRTSRWKNSR